MTPQERMLWQQWKPWVHVELIKAVHPRLSLYCTMKYNGAQSDKDYEECCDEEVNKHQFHLTGAVIYVGPHGAAAAITLTTLLQWFQVTDSTPHTASMIVEGHGPHELR